MKQWSREQIMKGLQELVPEIDLKKYDLTKDTVAYTPVIAIFAMYGSS